MHLSDGTRSMASTQVVTAMTLGEERTLHSFFANHTRRKKPEPTNSRLNHLDQEKSSSHITSCLEEDQNSHDLARQTAEHGNDHCALSASNPERSCHDDALSIANEQLPESDPGNETAFDDDTELQQPRKRRKLEPAEALLSWDEQLRSYARGAPGDLADHDVLDSQDKESPEPEGCFGSVVANGDHFGIESQPGGAGVDVNVPKSPITVSKTQEGSDGEISANGDIAPEAQSICEESNSNGGTLPHEIPTQGNKKASLKFDSKGKLVVPGVTLSERSKKRRTNRVSRSGNGKLKKLIITIPYGKDEASRVQTAARIDAILSTDRNSASATNVIRTSKAKGCEEKALHPFFLPGNRNQAPSTQQHSPSDKSVAASSGSPENTKRIRNSTAATPGKLRAQAKAMQADSALNMSIASTEGTGKRASKYSGSSGVLWPSQGMVHIRGSFSACTNQPENQKTDDQVRPLALKRQKGKDSKTPFEQDLQQLFRMADSTSARSYDTTLSSERLLISGKELQKFVSKQLSYHVRDIQLGQRPDMSKTRSQDAPAYSQFFRQFERIASGLTPFDRGLREAESWAQKYAPSRAEDVLQSGSEPMALRDWLQTLAVKAVEKGLLGDVKTQSSRKDQITGLKKKKRKKHDDVDGFIVSTDDEDDMMEQVEELEDDTLHAPGSKPSKSIFRVGDLTSNSKARMTNAVLLSGPHGSGKSATVYAVAKELGFEVFELNSGSRRGGKELLEKVGDMAENHLYQSTSEDQSNVASDGDNTRLGSALEKDLNTGRQGTMTSFFAPKALSTSKSGKTSAPQKPASKPKSNQSRSSSTQKQSLILLEEVDVLFEEDKNFWFSLTTLALSSKRPIVMTCNEESLVPVDSLNLHAILRFSPPSVDMVTDYLLLMAANEGHLIRRAAISDLFQSRRQDVRATIQQLDFLCQIGIQDRKGGLEWIYQRWPPGVDADADGNRLRVVSKDTFVENPNNQSLTSDPTSLGISAASHESSQQYTVEDAKMPAKDDSAKDIVHDVSAPEAMKKRPDILRTLELALDGRSAADIFCEAGSAFEYKDILDPTEPRIDDAERANFVEGYPLIQADLKINFTEIDPQLFAAMNSCAHSTMVQSGVSSLFTCDDPSRNDNASRWPVVGEEGAQLEQHRFLWHNRFLATFEPLTDSGSQTLLQSTITGPSVFEGTLLPIIEDAAPYVRSIVAFDLALEEQRIQQSGLLSQGGRITKKARLTRASRSALEGGKREATRRERWFSKSLNTALVLRTGGHDWRYASDSFPSRTASPAASEI